MANFKAVAWIIKLWNLCVKGREQLKSAFGWNDHLKIFADYLAISYDLHTSQIQTAELNNNRTKQKTNQTEQTKHLKLIIGFAWGF